MRKIVIRVATNYLYKKDIREMKNCKEKTYPIPFRYRKQFREEI